MSEAGHLNLAYTIASRFWNRGFTVNSSMSHKLISSPTAKSKKQRRLAAKAERARLTGLNASNEFAQVPLEEQSIDLPAGTSIEEGAKALEAREELNAAMRKARRKKIKENNFLRGMR